jgi:hypothetical protein
MIQTLQTLQFADVELDGNCFSALIEAKRRALAILHDCPHILPATTQLFNQLTSLPDANDLTSRPAGPEEWLACAIKALIEADSATADRSIYLERYAAKALEHAGRTLKHQQGLQDGYQEHVVQAATELEKNRQKATSANVSKGEKTKQKVIACHAKLLRERGQFVGIDKSVADEVGVSPSMVSKILNKKR